MITHKKINIVFEGINIDILYKKVKNISLRIIPPYGDVRLTIPIGTSNKYVNQFLNSKLDWINKHRSKYNTQRIDYNKYYNEDEEHSLFGCIIKLKLVENNSYTKVIQENNYLIIQTKDKDNKDRIKKSIDNWYKKELIKTSNILIEKWEYKLGIKSSELGIRKMKTRWGTCNIKTKKICLNFSLIYYPIQCLEYIIAHELCHLIERNHNKRFYNILHHHFPNYKNIKQELNNFVYLQ